MNPIDELAKRKAGTSESPYAQDFIAKRFKYIAQVGKFYHDTGATYAGPFDDEKTIKAKERELIGDAGTKAMGEVWDEGRKMGIVGADEALKELQHVYRFVLQLANAPAMVPAVGFVHRWNILVKAARNVQALRVMDHIEEQG